LAADPELESRLWSLVNHGFTKNFHFVHFEVAINAKINGLGAALAVGNLDHVEVVLSPERKLTQTSSSGFTSSGTEFRFKNRALSISPALQNLTNSSSPFT
jgi:dTDP-4-amino-4,6-dideoxygalactose transaminase